MNEPLAFPNPYIGPRPFTIQEQKKFFGRESEARTLLSLVIAERLVLFYAQSGAGKSSLINARLIPGLQERNFDVLPIGRVSGQREIATEIDNPFVYNLLLSLHSENIWVPIPDRALPHTTLPEYLGKLVIEETEPVPAQMVGNGGQPGKSAAAVLDTPDTSAGVRPLALIIDQFEEIFTTHPAEWGKREDFFDQLRRAQEADPYLWVVLAMREDFVARLDPYAHLLNNGLGLRARFYMERMSNEAALEAVRNPVRDARPFTPGVAEELVNSLRRIFSPEQTGDAPQYGQYVDPVQLQVVCYQLWEHLEKEPAPTKESITEFITMEDLNRLAGGGDLAQFISSALADFYEKAIASVVQAMQAFPERERVTERTLRDWFSNQLITKSETCNLVIRGAKNTGGIPNRVVNLLAEEFKFIIRTESRGADTWYQLSHDRLVSPILQANRAWYQRNSRPIMVDAEAWATSGKKPDKLYEGRQLQTALPLLDDPQADLNETEREFIRAGQLAASQQQARRNRFVIFVFSLVVLALAALAAFSLYQKNIAEAARFTEAQQRQTAEAASGLANQQRQTAEAASAQEAQQRQTAEAASTLAYQRAEEANRAQATAQAASAQEAQQRQKAEAAASAAEAANLQSQSSRLSSLSDYFRITNPDLSLLLAVESFKTASSLESRRALLNSIQSGITNRVTRVGFPLYTANRPHSVAFSPDGSQVAVGALGRVYLWNNTSGELVADLPASFEGKYSMYSVAFDATGNLLARGGGDGYVILWNRQANSTSSFRPFKTIKYSSVLSIAFQPGGNLLAVGTEIDPYTGRGHVYLYDTQEGKSTSTTATYDCGTYACVKVAWSADGKRLAFASRSGQIQVIDVTLNKSLLTVTRAHDSEISGLAWYPDGHRLVTSGYDQRLVQWDIDAQKALGQTALPKIAGPISLALSPDGHFLLAGINNDVGNWFGLWNAETLQKLDFKPSGHTQPVTAVAFAPQGSRFVTAGYDNTVNLWTYEPVDSPGTLLLSLPGPRVEAVGIDSIGKLVFARNTGGGLLDLITAGVEQPLNLKAPHAGLAIAQLDGKPAIVLGGVNGQVSFLHPVDGQPLRDPVPIGNQRVGSLAVSPDGRLLAAASCLSSTSCPQLSLHDLQTGQPLPLTGDLSKLQSISSLAFSPDATALAIGDAAGKITLYDLATGETRQAVTEGLQNVAVTSLAYSPAEQGLLIAGFQDGRIGLWDTATLGPVGEFVERLNGEVTGLLLRKSPTSGLWALVSASSQGEVREWEVDTNAWAVRACQMAARDLTLEEKGKFLLPGSFQGDVCPAQ